MRPQEKNEFEKQLKAAAREQKHWQRKQKNFYSDHDFCVFCSWKLDLIEEELEQIRRILDFKEAVQ